MTPPLILFCIALISLGLPDSLPGSARPTMQGCLNSFSCFGAPL